MTFRASQTAAFVSWRGCAYLSVKQVASWDRLLHRVCRSSRHLGAPEGSLLLGGGPESAGPVSPELFSRTTWDRPGPGEQMPQDGGACPPELPSVGATDRAVVWEHEGQPPGWGSALLPAFFALLILRGAELLVSQAPLSTQTPGRPRESCASGLTLRVTAGPGCSAEIGPSDGCERPGRTQRASTQGVQAGRSRRRMALGLAQDHRTRRWTLIPMRPLGFVWVE